MEFHARQHTLLTPTSARPDTCPTRVLPQVRQQTHEAARLVAVAAQERMDNRIAAAKAALAGQLEDHARRRETLKKELFQVRASRRISPHLATSHRAAISHRVFHGCLPRASLAFSDLLTRRSSVQMGSAKRRALGGAGGAGSNDRAFDDERLKRLEQVRHPKRCYPS